LIYIELKYTRRMARDIHYTLEEKIKQRTLELEESLEKLRKAKKELDSLDTAKTEFLNMISHEIRISLNGIMGSLTLIGRYDFSDEIKAYFSLLDISVKRLEAFSNSILEASKLRIKRDKALLFNEVDPAKLVKEIIELLSAKYSVKGIKISLISEVDSLKIWADQKYLTKCLIALLDNAFKYSAYGRELVITLTNNSDHFLTIIISDHGNNYSKASIEKIYEPLNHFSSRFDNNIEMGLHLAKLIVEAHSGNITVKACEPEGAEININLPI